MCLELVQWSLARIYIFNAWLEEYKKYHHLTAGVLKCLLEFPTVQIVVSQSIEPSSNTLPDGVATIVLQVRVQTLQL